MAEVKRRTVKQKYTKMLLSNQETAAKDFFDYSLL